MAEPVLPIDALSATLSAETLHELPTEPPTLQPYNLKRPPDLQQDVLSFIQHCYGGRMFTDVCIYPCDSTVPLEVHSVVLIAASPLFKKMAMDLPYIFSEGTEKVTVLLPEVSFQDLKLVVGGIYRNIVPAVDLLNTEVSKIIQTLSLKLGLPNVEIKAEYNAATDDVFSNVSTAPFFDLRETNDPPAFYDVTELCQVGMEYSRAEIFEAGSKPTSAPDPPSKVEPPRKKRRVKREPGYDEDFIDDDQDNDDDDEDDVDFLEDDDYLNAQSPMSTAMSTDIEYSCKLCQQSFVGSSDFTNHMKQSHNRTYYCCQFCPLNTPRAKDKVLHEKTVHLGQKPFACNRCNKRFTERKTLQLHIRTIHDGITFDCPSCTKKFSRPVLLKVHFQSKHADNTSIDIEKLCERFTCPLCNTEHRDDNILKCCQCEKEYPKGFQLRNHMKMTHMKSRQSPKSNPTPLSSEKQKFPCPECGKHYSSKSSLNLHVSCVHKQEKPFACHLCGKTCSQMQNLRIHIKQVHYKERNERCDHCGETFVYKRSLMLHVKNVHKPDEKRREMESRTRDHLCSECGQGFFRKFDLQSHVKNVHLKIKDFQCPICGNKFGTKQVLQKHQRTVHDGEKKFSCHICGKPFSDRGGLTGHIQAIHENKKEYECHLCGKGFNLKMVRNKHIRTVHEGIKEPKLYLPCNLCGKVLSTRDILGRHLRKVHNVRARDHMGSKREQIQQGTAPIQVQPMTIMQPQVGTPQPQQQQTVVAGTIGLHVN